MAEKLSEHFNCLAGSVGIAEINLEELSIGNRSPDPIDPDFTH